jgi:signal transduction histidine kinase
MTHNGSALADDAGTRRLIGIITHELRTPTSIILGYQELLSEGLLGPVNDRARDALDRIRRAAGQLRDLTDGLQILTGDLPARHNPGSAATDLAAAARRAVDMSSPDAEARGVRLDLVVEGSPAAQADPDAVDRLLDLLLAAVIRARHNGDVQILVSGDSHIVSILTSGARFDDLADLAALDARPDDIDSALGLRLAIAHRIATSLGGLLDPQPDSIRLVLPAATV